MNSIYKYGIMFLIGTTLCTACSKEEELTPSYAQDDYFSVPDGQNDAVSQIRRSFYEQTGVHLLFNDTLRNEYIGKDAYGDDVWQVETIEFGYGMTSYDYIMYQYEFLKETEYQKCSDFVKTHVMGKLKEGGSLFPYSVLLLSSLETKQYDYQSWESSATINCMRCLGISVGNVTTMTEDEKRIYGGEVLSALVSSKLDGKDDERLASFFQYVAQCYNNWGNALYPADIWDDWDGDISRVYELGFLSYNKDSWGDLDYDYFATKDRDLNDYLNAVLTIEPKEFEVQYAEYPIIIERYNVLRNVLIEIGVKL